MRVEAQPWGNASDEPLHVASAYFVFVAIDADGHSRPCPGCCRRRRRRYAAMREAEIRRAHRLARKQEIERGREN